MNTVRTDHSRYDGQRGSGMGAPNTLTPPQNEPGTKEENFKDLYTIISLSFIGDAQRLRYSPSSLSAPGDREWS
ncbi:hypothetical protein E2C01_018720 [Portunus trituberculatus]|uniref:Uncharacterized protein n=1 Tax=Portunus trituberculatus TaxID=210409 RepID=A0A5B7DV73_PORTR|nr:hypothetical protein [Portunus trituberculatus]